MHINYKKKYQKYKQKYMELTSILLSQPEKQLLIKESTIKESTIDELNKSPDSFTPPKTILDTYQVQYLQKKGFNSADIKHIANLIDSMNREDPTINSRLD